MKPGYKTTEFWLAVAAAAAFPFPSFFDGRGLRHWLPASHYSFWREPIMQQVVSKREQRLSSVIFAEYPAGSGKMFGCSVADQDNWNKLATLDSRGLVIYPFRAYTYDHMDFHDIVDGADLTAAIAAVSLAVMTERASADAVLNDVASAADEASAQAAADPYLAS